MDLEVVTPPDDGALPVAALKAQLRLASGFAGAGESDAELRGLLKAAVAVIEARTGKALLQRGLRLRLGLWRWPDAQALPLAPVVAVSGVLLRRAGGAAIPAEGWRLCTDRHRPRVVAKGAMLPAIPQGGRAEISFTAGFGADWASVPADLAQAVLLLAAEYFHGRGGMTAPLPLAVAGLLAPWQPLRITAGGHR